MSHTPLDGGAASCSPYRDAPAVALPRPQPSRLLLLGPFVMSALALIVTLTSLHLTAALVGLTRLRALARPAAPAAAPGLRLGVALEQTARRHRVPLFVAPAVDAADLRAAVADGGEGTLRDAVRALDAYAAARGLWLHDDDGVLRLEPEVAAADLDCADTLDACAARLERVASVTVQRAAAAGGRTVRLHITRATHAVEGARASLAAQGYQVDVVGRTLYVSDGPAAERAPDSGVRASRRGVYVVSRRWLDGALNSPQALMRSTRIVPETRGGLTVGVRVFGVRPDDALARLGIADGDVILRVNGLAVASPDRCLEAYARLRAADRLTVEILRGGRGRTLVYVIA
jgi:hypothetical protein